MRLCPATSLLIWPDPPSIDPSTGRFELPEVVGAAAQYELYVAVPGETAYLPAVPLCVTDDGGLDP